MAPQTERTTSKRPDAGFWSSSRTFFLPVGNQLEPSGVRGYPIDLRVKADVPRRLDQESLDPHMLHVWVTQYGLGSYERWLAGEGEAWLDAARSAARHLLRIQDANGNWMHRAPFPHTFTLCPPWASAITQGQGASLLVRLYAETGEAELAERAKLALEPIFTPQSEGGVGGDLGGRPWPEEYPTTPQSHVLNGAMFALWGVRDVGVGLGCERSRQWFEQGVDSLAANLSRYDTGHWSLYSLYPHPVRNRASSFYHDLHVNQLTAMEMMAPRPEFPLMRDRWAEYARSRSQRARAFAWKAAFRLLVPRNRWFARAAPWTRS